MVAPRAGVENRAQAPLCRERKSDDASQMPELVSPDLPKTDPGISAVAGPVESMKEFAKHRVLPGRAAGVLEWAQGGRWCFETPRTARA